MRKTTHYFVTRFSFNICLWASFMLYHCQIFVSGNTCLWYMCVVYVHMHVCTAVRQRRVSGVPLYYTLHIPLSEGLSQKLELGFCFWCPPFPTALGLPVYACLCQSFYVGTASTLIPWANFPAQVLELIRPKNTSLYAQTSFCLSI